MKQRIFTYLSCECGHRGAIVESIAPVVSAMVWYQAWLRDLSHNGSYDGLDELFAETTPACPACGRSLGPEHIVARSEPHSPGELTFPDRDENGAAAADKDVT